MSTGVSLCVIQTIASVCGIKLQYYFYADGIRIFVNYLCQAHARCSQLQNEYQYRFLVNRQLAGEADIWLCPCCESVARSKAAPCTACKKKVLDHHDALTCDHCNRWTHRTCGTGEFMLLQCVYDDS